MQRYGRVLGYCRVSSEGQAEHGTSLAAQEERLRAYCQINGLPAPILRIEVESGAAERLERRVELQALIADAKPGDLILTPKVDRWSRDLPWGVASVRALVARGVGWRAIDDVVDATTLEGDRALGWLSLMADEERKRIKERTVGARRRLRRAGCFVEGLPPIGYKVTGRKLVIDQSAAPIVRRMFAMCVDGYSLREIEAVFAEAYPDVPGLDMGAIGRRLRDRRYLGEINTIGTRGRGRPKGEWIKSHEPIIDQETWDRAQAALDGRRIGGRPLSGEAKTASFLCRGAIVCERCGHIVHSWAPETGASTKHGGYYQCGNKCVRARHADVDALVEREMRERLPALAGLLVQAPARATAAPRVDNAAKMVRLTKSLERLLDAVAEGTFTNEEARPKVAKLRAEIAALKAKPAEPHVAPPKALRGPDDVMRAWESIPPVERNEIVRALVERIDLASTATKKWQRGAWTVRVTWREMEGA